MNAPVSLTTHEWLDLLPPQACGGLASQMAIKLASRPHQNEKHLRLFMDLLAWGASVQPFELAKVNAQAEYVEALAAKNPALFASEEALRGGVEFNHEPTLKAVAAHMPKVNQERLLQNNSWTWIQWHRFDGLEQCEDILKVRPDFNWFGDATAGEDFLVALRAAKEQNSARWIDRVLNHVGHDLDFLMPIGGVDNQKERAELERFILSHRNRETSPTAKQAAPAL